MFANLRAARLTTAVACTVLLSASTVREAHAQSLEVGPVTVQYAGLGALVWMPAPGIKANLVVPNITAGARVSCFQASYKCDIGVQRRTIEYFARQPAELVDEVRGQFKSGSPLEIVSTAQGVEATFIDRAANARYPYTTVALIFRGAALLRAVAQGPDLASVNAMINIARTVRPVAARETMAASFAQFVGVCTTRFPGTATANERALAISAFSDASVLATVRQRDTSMTMEKVRAARAIPNSLQLASFDGMPPSSRERFCNELPGIIAAATRDLRAL